MHIRFKNGRVYTFTRDGTGSEHLECMKLLALAGYGLNSFIQRVVRRRVAKRRPFGRRVYRKRYRRR